MRMKKLKTKSDLINLLKDDIEAFKKDIWKAEKGGKNEGIGFSVP